MGILEKAWHISQDAEKQFKHKAVLFIPSESYDAATITIMQGLEELGFVVYTIGKANINSWWMNKIVENPRGLKFDFVLSNMHWGTRWDFYDKYNLHKHFKVLIDGCDNRAKHTWRDKYDFYCRKYWGKAKPQEPVLSRDLQPYRWMEPLGRYKPDIVFTSQKNPGDKETFYLPFGIHREAQKFHEGKLAKERGIDFTNIPGPGIARKGLTDFMARVKLPGRVHNSKISGGSVIPKEIERLVWKDNNVHSYFRWVLQREYFKILNDTKVLIYSNVYDRAHWDSKKIWEGLASGCLPLFEKPRIDMSQYPVTELCPELQFEDYDELVDKAQWLYHSQGYFENMRLQVYEGALRYFTPLPLARRFLWFLSKQKGTK